MGRTQQAQYILLRLSNRHLPSLLFDQLPGDTTDVEAILPDFLKSGLENVSDESGWEVPAQVHEQDLSMCRSAEGRVYQIGVRFCERVIEIVQRGELVVECT